MQDEMDDRIRRRRTARVTATRNMTEDELQQLPVRIGIKTVAAALGVGINEA